MKKAKRTQQYKRRREGKTDYRKRLSLLLSGEPRLIVRKSLKHVYAQIVRYGQDGDEVLVSANTVELVKKYGMQKPRRNTTTAYLVGLLAGKKAVAKNIKKAIFDIGMHRPIKNAVIFAVLKGAVDAGMNVPHSKDVIPPESRIKGEHLKDSQYEVIKNKIIKEQDGRQ